MAEFNHDNLVMTKYPTCSLGFRANSATHEVDYVSPHSSLYGILNKGNIITHYREAGDAAWQEIKHHTNTHGPNTTQIELLVKQDARDKPVIMTGTRFAFIEMRDLTNGQLHLLRTNHYRVQHCDQPLAQAPVAPAIYASLNPRIMTAR